MSESLSLGLYSIKDEKMNVFFPPFCAQNNLDAQRRVGIMTTDPAGQLHHYPADYSLYRVGSFSTDAGQLFNTAEEPAGFPTYVENVINIRKGMSVS